MILELRKIREILVDTRDTSARWTLTRGRGTARGTRSREFKGVPREDYRENTRITSGGARGDRSQRTRISVSGRKKVVADLVLMTPLAFRTLESISGYGRRFRPLWEIMNSRGSIIARWRSLRRRARLCFLSSVVDTVVQINLSTTTPAIAFDVIQFRLEKSDTERERGRERLIINISRVATALNK